MQPQSITEFIPLNLAENEEENEEHTVTVTATPTTDKHEEEELAYSQTADSMLADSTSNNMKPQKPANNTGAIPVINKYKKPSKLSGF